MFVHQNTWGWSILNRQENNGSQWLFFPSLSSSLKLLVAPGDWETLTSGVGCSNGEGACAVLWIRTSLLLGCKKFVLCPIKRWDPSVINHEIWCVHSIHHCLWRISASKWFCWKEAIPSWQRQVVDNVVWSGVIYLEMWTQQLLCLANKPLLTWTDVRCLFPFLSKCQWAWRCNVYTVYCSRYP